MFSSWIENYRGRWENCEGFVIRVKPRSERAALVDIERGGVPIERPWCARAPTGNLDALYRVEDGLGLEVRLGRDGFALYLDYEASGGLYEKECLTAAISRLVEDEEAEQWMMLVGTAAYFRGG